MTMLRQACFWLTTGENANRERERHSMVGGRRIVERVPQHGHDGTYEDKRKARGIRYITVVRHEGHIVPLLLTNAAAHLDPSTPYGNYQRRKAAWLGWYPEGGCPTALMLSGELKREHVVSDTVRTAQPCEQGTHSKAKPCVHDLAERVARRDAWNTAQAERMSAFRSEAERHLSELRAENRALVVDVAKAVADQISTAAAPTPAAPPQVKK